MTRHATVAELVRRRCPDADLLLEMMGVLIDGQLQPDDDRDYGDVDTAQLGSRAKADKVVSVYDDMRVRPKVSTAPEGLRELPPETVASKVGKRRATGPRGPRTDAQLVNVRKAAASREAPCGTYTAKRRHKRRGEPICRDVENARSRARYAALLDRPVVHRQKPKCGSHSGASSHVKRGEPVCEPCKVARRAYERERYARRKAA